VTSSVTGGPRRALLLLALLLGACAAPYALVQPGRQIVAGALSVQPGIAWNRINAPPWEGKVEVWSLDGPALDSLTFIVGTGDGEPLLWRKLRTGGAAPLPAFRRDMTGIEIAELFTATLARNHLTPIVEVTSVAPAQLGAAPGFRFEIRYVGRDEVERAGTAVGTVRAGRLHLLWFEGARSDHYRRHLAEFERIVASVRFIDR